MSIDHARIARLQARIGLLDEVMAKLESRQFKDVMVEGRRYTTGEMPSYRSEIRWLKAEITDEYCENSFVIGGIPAG